MIVICGAILIYIEVGECTGDTMILGQNGIIYMALMEKAMEDNILTHEEKRILDVIRQNMQVSDEEIDIIESHFDGNDSIDLSSLDLSLLEDEKLSSGYRDTFKHIVREAIFDKGISRDEFAMIFLLSEIIKLPEEDRRKIFEEIRSEAGSRAKDPEIRERLEQF